MKPLRGGRSASSVSLRRGHSAPREGAIRICVDPRLQRLDLLQLVQHIPLQLFGKAENRVVLMGKALSRCSLLRWPPKPEAKKVVPDFEKRPE